MNLNDYDLILVNTSGGKDSSVAAFVVTRMAEEWDVKSRIVLVHATFAEEWAGTVDLVRKQAEQLALPLVVVERGEDLLKYVERRGMWPSSQQRYCTSDFKRAPIDKVITARAPGLDKPAKVLNVMGIRADESPARAKRQAFKHDERRTNGRRIVDEWLPIFSMTLERVWAIIKANGIPVHPAYALGMPRLSCVFCIFAPKAALVLAGKHNPELLRRYAEVEKKIGHQFRGEPGKKGGLSMAEVLDAVEAGASGPVPDWKM
jgi:3'-phosphoadenosine 5'-phosphosulfate sulfotransferase (PAPS reductase)/FAD synthetase